MASNFLSLNSSKTEFLLIGLPTRVAKIDNPCLSMPSSTAIKPVASARNLGVIFDSNLFFSDHISYISKICFAHMRDLRRIRNTLDHTTACTNATPFQTWLLQFTFSESQLLAKQTNHYNLFSTLLFVLSLKHLNLIISLLISNISTGSKSHNAYNTKISLSHTSHCNSNSHLLFWIFLKFSQLIPFVHLQLSPSSVLPIYLGSKLLTDPSTTKHLLSGIHCPNICVLFLQHHLLKTTTLSSRRFWIYNRNF